MTSPAALILALALVAVGGGCRRSAPASATAAAKSEIRLVVAHTWVHDSVRAAFADAIAEYERLHPEIRVQTLEVPERLWPAWRRTRLIGDNPPDILPLARGIEPEQIARHLFPLGSDLARPNPYNAGTPLADVAWRDTFVNGLTDPDSFNPLLVEYYGALLYASTMRLYWNLDLLRELTGRERPPETLDEFFTTAAEITAGAAKLGRPVYPVAGSDYHAPLLLNRLFTQQSQRLVQREERQRRLHLDYTDAGLLYLNNGYSHDAPPIRAGWELLAEVGRCFQPGFINTQREDATFLFRQQRAVALPSGSWDAGFLLKDSPFRVGIADFPLPRPGETRFGRNVLGPVTELEASGSNALAVLRSSPRRAHAIDFLQFLTSREINERFCRISLRIPSIVGAEPAPEIVTFEPVLAGWRTALHPSYRDYGGRWQQRLFQTESATLFNPQGGTEEFLKNYVPAFERAVRQDLAVEAAEYRRSQQRSDSMLIALHVLGSGGDRAAAARGRQLAENQHLWEARSLQIEHALNGQK